MSANRAIPEEKRSRSLKPLLRKCVDLIARISAANPELARQHQNLFYFFAYAWLVESGGNLLSTVVDARPQRRQEIDMPWPRKEGVFLVRCVAQPSAQPVQPAFWRRNGAQVGRSGRFLFNCGFGLL